MNEDDLLNKLKQINVHIITAKLGGGDWIQIASDMLFDLVEELKNEEELGNEQG